MSIRTKHLAALAVAAILAACGGGDTPTPEAAIDGLRMQVRALQGVAPTEAARQLMDFGESRFPQYFPTHEATQSLPPFAYRYYPQTGVYLGVVLTEGMGWQLNGVYVMGGSFGSAPQLVGLLTDFITPTPPATSTGNGCFDLTLAQTAGTRIVVNYSVTGSMTGSLKTDSLVGSPTTFAGQQALLTTVATTGSGTTADGSASIDTNVKLYSSLPGSTDVTQYGQEAVTSMQGSGYTVTTTTRTVWTPPYVDPQYTLALGQSATSTLSGSMTSTMSGIPGVPSVPSTTTISQTATTKFAARESVTVGAGTFDTCRFEVTTSGAGSSSTVTSWVMFGKGIPVRTLAADQDSRATSISLNGQPL